MRPIYKGACPQVGGIDKQVKAYRDWRKDLIDRIGEYCVYCNMKITQSLQVEHVIPKVPVVGAVAGALLDWDNMLLACGPCNRAKWNYPCNDTLYYLPESHNTHLPFQIKAHATHKDAAIVTPAAGMTPSQEQKAKATVAFFHLDEVDKRSKIVDLRWRERFQATVSVAFAVRAYRERKSAPNFDASDAAKDIAIRARDAGFFSLWYEAFANEPLVMYELINNIPATAIIPGTAQDCFDAANGYKPKPRNPGNTADPF